MRPESLIYTPKQDNEHSALLTFRMEVPPPPPPRGTQYVLSVQKGKPHMDCKLQTQVTKREHEWLLAFVQVKQNNYWLSQLRVLYKQSNT